MTTIAKLKNKYIGDRDFYAKVLIIVVPMILQNLITNFVSMLDNIMVGRVGTAQMSGVSIVNQFIFIFNITIFGAISGPGIFGAQFFGKGDSEGQKYTVRFRLILVMIIAAVFGVVFKLFDTNLISIYLAKDDAPQMLASTLSYGREYMAVMIFSLIPFGVGQAYGSVIRECGETRIPMYASAAAVGINLVLDYGLIFGKLGMPCLGVKGAAIATVTAKAIEALVCVIWAHVRVDKNKYIVGMLKSAYIPSDLLKDMTIKGIPLMFNEFLWVIGMSAIAQCYSVRGLDVVAARNIASTITNLFGVVYIQLGACISIMIGALLGAGKLTEAVEADDKFRAFSIFIGLTVGSMMVPFAKVFPLIYNTEDEVRALASYIIIISAIAMPIWSYTNASYFTLRSGGKTGITFLFDFVFTWFVMIPLGFGLAYFTDMDIHPLFAIVTLSEALKMIVGYFMIKSNIWVNNLVG